jgi:transcriptional regulator GlxA family with amidase domain
MTRQVALFLFERVEVLDFAGPFEVFSTAQDEAGQSLFKVMTFSIDGQLLRARNGLQVVPDYSLLTLPPHDILIIPGGPNAAIETQMQNIALMGWIAAQKANAELLLSVCTGSWMLAKAGVLAGRPATTYHTDYDRLRALEPTVITREGERWVDSGDIITSAGVSAGIDMSLYVVGKLHGAATAEATARRMEYEYWQQAVKATAVPS